MRQFASTKESPRPTIQSRVRPAVEELESRHLLAGNLQITNALLVTSANNPIAAPAVGEMVFVRAEFRTTGLTAADRYVVRFTMDGVPLDSATLTGAAGTNLAFSWYRGGWYASPGSHTLQVTVDGANAVAETDETDNTRSFVFSPTAPTTLPAKFVWPLTGTPSQDWAIVNYADVNPLTGATADFNGGPFQYDGHTAIDVRPANFADMDAGVPIFAAAAGTVGQVQDGNFDRETAFNSNPANFIRIDHGNGWSTLYLHLMRNSITVRAGDTVAAGQLLGFMGSSGSSTDAHLHFEVQHNGAPVETYYDPTSYYLSPLPYQLNQTIRVLDAGITNASPAADAQERPQDIDVFPTSSASSVWFWYNVSHLNTGDNYQVKWYRPNGTVATSFGGAATSVQRSPFHNWFISRATWSTVTGTWQVALEVNGVEKVRRSFQVTSGTGVPSVRVTQGTTYILDDRTTPIDFGSASFAGLSPQRTFTIQNLGSAPLSLSNLVAPTGFFVSGLLPLSVPAGGTGTFALSMDTTTMGPRFGQVRFTTDDPDEGVFSFNVSGTVTGTPVSGTPVLTLPGPALPYHVGQAPKLLDSRATLSDSDSPILQNGSVTVELAAGATANDRIGIRQQGIGAGQIGVSGSNVTFGGAAIGTFSGGTATTPLVINLNNGATQAAVQALLRNLTYANTVPTDPTNPRYVRVSVRDNFGQTSDPVVKLVVPINDPPTISDIPNQNLVVDNSTPPILFTAGDARKLAGNLNATASSSNQAIIRDAELLLGGTGPNRTLTITSVTGQPGTVTISVTVTDVNGGMATDTFQLVIAAINRRPARIEQMVSGTGPKKKVTLIVVTQAGVVLRSFRKKTGQKVVLQDKTGDGILDVVITKKVGTRTKVTTIDGTTL